MKKALLGLTLVVAGLGAGARAHAAPIIGSATISSDTPATSGPSTDLNTATNFTISNLNVATAIGDFSFTGAMAAAGPWTIDEATLATGGGFSVADPLGWGTFTATSGVLNASDHAKAFTFVGNFTPGAGNPGFDANSMQFLVQLSQVGGADTNISVAGSLASPAPSSSVPEPGGLALLTIGLVSIGGAAWRERRRTR